MPREQYSSIRVGLFVVGCGVVIILIILALGERSFLFQHHYSLTATFENAGGLISGAPVRVAGVNAGSVRRIKIVREQPSGKAKVQLTLSLGTTYQSDIGDDSVATIRSLGLLGDKYVEITLGSESAPSLSDGATIRSEEAVDYNQMADEARETFRRANEIAKEILDVLGQLNKAALVKNVDEATQTLSRILTSAEKGPSLIHSLAYDPDLPKALDDLRAASKSLRVTAEKVESGKGGLGELIHGEKLSQALADFADAVDSAKALLKEVEKGEGVAHALIYDKAERQALDQLGAATEKLNAVLGDIRDGKGSLGLLIVDPSVWESLQRLLSSANESTILKFFIQRSLKDNPKP
jgi:phospholipid/cholesterol/gamma-HCH transport system substrate-binding protein